jgi:AraC family transcriptional regulator
MVPRIENIAEKKLVGLSQKISFADYKIAALWRSFMPLKNQIVGTLSSDLISMVLYAPNHFIDFKPTNEYL